MQLTRLNLIECISIADHKRKDQGLAPIKSIRALALELEFRWPSKYNSTYIANRLHRANKNGIGKMHPDLIVDIIYILRVDISALVHYPGIDNLMKEPRN